MLLVSVSVGLLTAGRLVVARPSPSGKRCFPKPSEPIRTGPERIGPVALMCTFILLLLLGQVSPTPLADDTAEPTCLDWTDSVPSGGAASVVAGQVGWLSCPLLPSSVHSTSHAFTWYRLPWGHEEEQPITPSGRLSREGERLWLQPATDADAGLYICKLRNRTSCTKASILLSVLPSNHSQCLAPPPPPPRQVPLQEGAELDCPDLEVAAKMADSEPTVTWFHLDPRRKSPTCHHAPLWHSDLEQRGARLHIHVMLDSFHGSFFCCVRYRRRSQELHFGRRLDLSAVYSTVLSERPTILLLAPDDNFPVIRNSEVRLVCRALFPFLDSSWSLFWQVDGVSLDQLADHHRFSTLNSLVSSSYGERKEESVLVIQDFLLDDLRREFNCSAENGRGLSTRSAHLTEEVRLPWKELCCGLAAMLLLTLLLFVIYHVFWLELLLLYRSWFGTDERLADDKEYDVYISYSRNSEDEDFVLSTLRSVLETQLGYTVCIFDRDSLPGGTITDETLSFVARSRRLLVVVSPGYASQGSQALLELKTGLDSMARGGHLRVILVQYRPVKGQGWVKELRRARLALVLVRWPGDQSQRLTSRFWKRLRVELPLREGSSQEEAGLTRLLPRDVASNPHQPTLPPGASGDAPPTL